MKEKLLKYVDCMLPICLLGPNFIMIILWTLNLYNNRMIRGTALALYLLVFIVKSIDVYITQKEQRKVLFFLCLIPTLWILIFFKTIIQNNFDGLVIGMFRIFIWNCFPVFIFILSIIFEKKESIFIRRMKWFGCILSPIIIYYLGRMMSATTLDYGLINLGPLHYMAIAYLCLPILIFCMLDLLVNNYDKVVLNNLNVALVILLTTAILLTGTRGAYLSVVIFICTLICYMIVNKIKNRRVFNTIILMIISVGFFSLIWSPPASGLWRVNHLVKQVYSETTERNNYSLKRDIAEVSNKKDLEKSSTIKENTIKGYFNYIILQAKYSKEKHDITAKLMSEYFEKQKRNSRSILSELAYYEANSSPLLGIGSMAFQLKYGSGFYPHNAILEIAAEWGYIIAGCFVAFMMKIYMSIYQWARKDITIACMFIFFLGNTLTHLFESIYINHVSLMIVTYYFAKKYTDNVGSIK